jgi:diguanylate cyclase (GGDEF)-like protein
MRDGPVTLVVVEGPGGAALEGLCTHLSGYGHALERRAGLPGAGADLLRVDGVLVDAAVGLAPVFEWLRALRAEGATVSLPVLLASALPLPEATVTAALEAGADEVLCAPWALPQVRARLARAVALRRRTEALGAQLLSLARMGHTDGLTGLPNARAFSERLGDEFRRAQRYGDALALGLVGVDHLRVGPDGRGHALGEEVLQQVAAVLRKCARDTDLVCRPGEGLFALLLPRTSLGGALTLAERTLQALQALRLGPGGALRVGVAMGLASFPHRTVPTAESLQRAAEEALHRARHAGTDRVCLAHGLVGVGSAAHGW